MNEVNRTVETTLHQSLFQQYPAEAVQQLERLDPVEIGDVLAAQPIDQTIKIWERFSPQLGASVLGELPVKYGAELLGQIDPNRGASLLKGLGGEKRKELLSATDRGAASDLNRALAYEPNTAGALMEARVMYFRPEMTVGETINILRSRPKRAYRKLYTVDENNRLKGMIEIEELALADHSTMLSELEHLSPAVVEVTASREELVEKFERHKATDLPVVDFDRHLVGILRYHVFVDAAREESSIDLQTMVGVSKDERGLSPAGFAIRKRLPWLEINLATAFMAAAVVGLFEETIAKYTALAVLLPVVAGQSGNTGAQALAVTLRGLALKEVYPRMWPRIIFKESFVGFWNGVAVGLTTGVCVYIWSKSFGLTLIITMSMIISMAIASISGAAIPIIMTVSGQDPAQSSSIFLTTVTDVAGFFSFLGIATLFIAIL
ncbi:MAG: magnesium transporter [Gammaproteobacteria bacterium]|nr:magnesium transporter [Gammaproteobacteria bacterium]